MFNDLVALRNALSTMNFEVVQSLSSNRQGVSHRLKYSIAWLALAIQSIEDENAGRRTDDAFKREKLFEKATSPMIESAFRLGLQMDGQPSVLPPESHVPKIVTTKERIAAYLKKRNETLQPNPNTDWQKTKIEREAVIL
jgi:hypothetical protein